MHTFSSEVEIECVKPIDLGYYTQWQDQLWLKGPWQGAEKITHCFDPLRCYDKPPSLPGDYTVVWNVTDDDPPPDAPVNYTVQYKCDRKCKSSSALLFFLQKSTNLTHNIYNLFTRQLLSRVLSGFLIDDK